MRWLTAALKANGVEGPLSLDVALDVAEQLVATGRAIPPAKWVTDFKIQRNRQELDGLF